jgi:uncharacterized protein DUF5681
VTKTKRSKKGHAKDDGREYEVGYGKPPKQHQFKSGQTGNPNGRPKGAQNADVLARKILSRPIKVREGGKERKVSTLEGILMRFAERGLKGDPKAADFLIKLYRQVEDTPSDGDALDANDREIFDLLLREVGEKQQGNAKEAPDDK